MTTVTDAPGVQSITNTDAIDDAAADREEDVTARAELARLLAQAYVPAPLFA